MKPNKQQRATAREEILDTIKVCTEYLGDAAAHAGQTLGAVFSADAIAFAKAQIAYETARLATL